MVKQRVSNVQAYHSLTLSAVSEKREHLKKVFCNEKEKQPKQDKGQSEVKKSNSMKSKQPIQIIKIENETQQNIVQWGKQVKVDIEKVKALAAKLKTTMKKPATRIRYQG